MLCVPTVNRPDMIPVTEKIVFAIPTEAIESVSRKLLTNSPSIILELRVVSSIKENVMKSERKLWSTIGCYRYRSIELGQRQYSKLQAELAKLYT